jgi:hypothetical protein
MVDRLALFRRKRTDFFGEKEDDKIAGTFREATLSYEQIKELIS